MNTKKNLKSPLPPHLSMDDYADFVEQSIMQSDPIKVARQKSIEKKITKAFRIPQPCTGNPQVAPLNHEPPTTQ